MKLLTIGLDVAALSIFLGTAAQIIPTLVGLLAAVYYAFVVYDRIRYGPEIENRMFWERKKKTPNEARDA
jgi:small-conductance mechanosensitive channel